MILIAPDKFKGTLTARQVCDAIREGLLDANPLLDIISVPLADGGEGTSDLLTEFSGGSMINVDAVDPLFRAITASYGVSGDGETAFIEMAKASGLQLLSPAEKNPLYTTTLGVGQLIADAIDRNVKNIVLGIGGSATNDAGMGMAMALGFRFLSAEHEELKPIGQNLIRVHSITTDHLYPKLNDINVTVIYDVDNPLYGDRGAAHVFAGQKGASATDIQQLDAGLRNFAAVVSNQFNTDINFPGAGAGGGISAAAKIFLNATFSAGIDFIMRFSELETKIRNASVVITGEGKIDEQTFSGKVVAGVARLAMQNKKPCVAFAGKCELTKERIEELGVSQVVSVMGDGTSEEDAMGKAAELLKAKAGKFGRLMNRLTPGPSPRLHRGEGSGS